MVHGKVLRSLTDSKGTRPWPGFIRLVRYAANKTIRGKDAKRRTTHICTFEALRDEVARLEASHPDQAVVLIEISVGVVAQKMPQASSYLPQSIGLHADGLIWSNVVSTFSRGSAGMWDGARMRLDVTVLPRRDLSGFVPEHVQIAGGDAPSTA
jgi:hypothetical protein